ncbi:hypothetical protein AUP68_12275 [Ilyonectria robusta]
MAHGGGEAGYACVRLKRAREDARRSKPRDCQNRFNPAGGCKDQGDTGRLSTDGVPCRAAPSKGPGEHVACRSWPHSLLVQPMVARSASQTCPTAWQTRSDKTSSHVRGRMERSWWWRNTTTREAPIIPTKQRSPRTPLVLDLLYLLTRAGQYRREYVPPARGWSCPELSDFLEHLRLRLGFSSSGPVAVEPSRIYDRPNPNCGFTDPSV